MCKSVVTAFVLLFFSSVVCSQGELISKELFVRIYDAENIKIAKGFLSSVNDSGMVVLVKKKEVLVRTTRINTVKTRRSAGHNIGMGAMAGFGAGGIYGLLQEEGGSTFGSSSRGDDAIIYGTVGLMLGSVVGGLTALGKDSDSYLIEGDSEKLSAFRDAVNQLPAKE